MRITQDKRSGWITCARDRVIDGRCEGYKSEPVELVVETVERLFGDAHSDWSDPYSRAVSTTHEYLRLASGEDPTCRHCGAPATLSLEPRTEYRRLSDKGPEQVVAAAEIERARAGRELELVSAQERQASALESLVQQGDQTGEVAQLRAVVARQAEQLERLVARLEPNGHGEPEPAPRPRRKTA